MKAIETKPLVLFVLTAMLLGMASGALAQDVEQPVVGAEGPVPTVISTQPGVEAPGITPTPPKSAQVGPELEFRPITSGPELTLRDALDMVAKRSSSYRAALEDISVAEARYKQALALVLPGAQATLTLMHRDHEDSFNFSDSLPASMAGLVGDMPDTVIYPQQEMKGTVEIGMPLINAQNWFTISAAKEGIEAARYMTEGQRQEELLEVVKYYLTGLTAKAAIRMCEEQARSAMQQLRVAQARFDAGAGLKIDVLRAQTDLEEAKQNLNNAHLGSDIARDLVAMFAGFEDGLPMLVEVAPVELPEGEDDELAAQAVENLPAMKALHSAIRAQEKLLDASWMQFLPNLSVGWQLSHTFTELAAMGSVDRTRWALMFTLTVPIYNHFRYGDLDEKRATLRQMILREEDGAKGLATGVRVARRQYLTALSNALTAQRQAELAEEGLRLVRASYEAGTGTSLDVTVAQKTLSMAQTNVISTNLKAQQTLLIMLNTIGQDLSTVAQ